MRDQREKLEEEKKVFYDFGKVIMEASRKQVPIRLEEAEQYQAELKAMSDIARSSFMKGLLAGAVSFVGLRFIRRGATRWFSRRSAKPLDVRTHLDAKTFAELRSNHVNPFHTEGQTFNNPWIKAFHFTTDVLTSMFITIFATYQCFDLNKSLPVLSRMPLMEGRSRVADLLCEDVVKEMKRHPPEFWENIQHPRMKAIAQLGWNCERRWAYEKFLLKQGGRENETGVIVVIPPPGVPPSYPIDEEKTDQEFGQYWYPKDSDQEDDFMNGFVSDNNGDPKWR